MGTLFINLGTLEGGLKFHSFSGLPGGGPEVRPRTSGVVVGRFLAPTVSINMATKHEISDIKTSNMQESKHTMAIGCKMKETQTLKCKMKQVASQPGAEGPAGFVKNDMGFFLDFGASKTKNNWFWELWSRPPGPETIKIIIFEFSNNES